MVKVIAKMVGFYGGRIREIGDEFEIANDDVTGEGQRLPLWVELAKGEKLPEVKPVQKGASGGEQGQEKKAEKK